MSLLASFNSPINVVLVGASGGIGQALLHALLADPGIAGVHALSRSTPETLVSLVAQHPQRLSCDTIDLNDESAIATATERLGDLAPDLVLVTTGLLHDGGKMPEKSWRALETDYFHQQMQINALAPALLAKHLIPRMPTARRAVFAVLSARVGSIGDNRLGGWYSYRASKAALNMLLRCTAIEAKRRWPQLVVAGLHPGTVDTALSQPFQGRVPEGKLFTPAFAAESLLKVIDGLTPDQSGRVFAWDGQAIPP
ncbi:SDR family NAD(P)-dependent oxidoreductase [Marinobacterium sediminicola]|uniref:NAD(P)-dependent dehydrogenase, short-chain alcohol dehydrogenase family n=1 Tax=Marinobacterium sediminicola TaxID=518898 RepID=A0ABY1S1K8_9GAMM|nr:SDR family NAD(P)-dependent oxidoreductase [Marinobacterium sediminicola]ULG69390.1 SDR family NAD(P)-dependent oxidoreductase [Marinobacterium sediminicola]SMR75538.1 NAD(P)-dependent dehydrogenase, short-chain alcohol dehydrogenase family [Marinobacterium sediminicola]